MTKSIFLKNIEQVDPWKTKFVYVCYIKVKDILLKNIVYLYVYFKKEKDIFMC